MGKCALQQLCLSWLMAEATFWLPSHYIPLHLPSKTCFLGSKDGFTHLQHQRYKMHYTSVWNMRFCVDHTHAQSKIFEYWVFPCTQ